MFENLSVKRHDQLFALLHQQTLAERTSDRLRDRPDHVGRGDSLALITRARDSFRPPVLPSARFR